MTKIPLAEGRSPACSRMATHWHLSTHPGLGRAKAHAPEALLAVCGSIWEFPKIGDPNVVPSIVGIPIIRTPKEGTPTLYRTGQAEKSGFRVYNKKARAHLYLVANSPVPRMSYYRGLRIGFWGPIILRL